MLQIAAGCAAGATHGEGDDVPHAGRDRGSGIRDPKDACPAPARTPPRDARAFPQRFFFDRTFSATAAFTSVLNARASTVSPSWMSIARRVPASRLALKRRFGSGRLAPFANVSFTAFL